MIHLRRLERFAVVVVCAVAVTVATGAGCGIDNDTAPRRVSAADVPYGLLEEAPSTTTSTALPVVPKVAVLVYLVAGNHIQPVVREVNDPPTIAKSMTALLAGPREDEAAAGLRSAINPGAGVQTRGLDGETLTIELTGKFALAPSTEQVLGLAQIVFTATEFPGVTGVRFTLEGEPIDVPTPTGSLASPPVGRDAFAALAPPA